MPTVSIIIPIYNAARYLRLTLDSILYQTYPDWEAILVDDGSIDESAKICEEYVAKDARFKVLHKSNGGVGETRNLGISIANGEFVCFLDSDDQIRPSMLEGCINSICDADILIFGFKYRNNRTEERILKPNIVKGVRACRDYLYDLKETPRTSEFFCFPWNKMYKRSLLTSNKIEFPTDISLREDEIFAYRYIPFVQNIRAISEVYVDYNDEASGLSAKKNAPDKSVHLANYLLYQTKCDNSNKSKTILFLRAMTYMQDAIINTSDLQEKKNIAIEMINAFSKKEFQFETIEKNGKLNILMEKVLNTRSVIMLLIYAKIIQCYRLFKIYIMRDVNLKRWGTNV